MKAARLHAVRDMRVEEVPLPGAPGAGEVSIAVAAAGICGSDVHNWRTGQWLGAGPPRVAGHEFAGTVTAVGEGVDAVRPGDLVVADSRYWCGACDQCLAGRRNVCRSLGFVGEVCDGGFAAEAVLPARLAVPVPEGTDPVLAAMAEPLAVALHAVRRLAAPPGVPVLVAGCGPIGGLAALLLSRHHDGPVLVCDRNASRASLVARTTGATVTDLAAEGGGVVRHALDATGSTAVIDGLARSLGAGGALVLVGISHGILQLDPNLLVERELAVVGSHAFTDELPEAAAMIRDLAPALAGFVDERIGLDGIPAAYERLARGEAAGLKTIVLPDRG